jgi:outer membrane protein assembly factor BamB
MKCLALLLALLSPALPAADWPQWMGPQRDGVWDEPNVSLADPAKATLLWEVKTGGGYAGPSVAGGKVFTFSFHRAPDQTDTSRGIMGEEELLCISAADGKELWRHRHAAAYTIDYADGPRATPTVHGAHVYALGAEGRLLCAETATGKIIWKHDLKDLLRAKSPLWGFAGHPLVWDDLLLCLGAGDSGTAVAFDRLTGEEKWRALGSRQGGYCPPVLIEHEGKPVLILWHGESINALNPRTGAVLWSIPRETKFGVAMAAPVHHDGRLLVSNFWWGAKMLQLPTGSGEPEVIWETERESDTRTEHLNALMCSPLLVDGHLYGVCSYGQFRCLEWKTGKRLWETFAPTSGKEARWGNAFLTRLGRSGNDFLLASEQGDLIRASLTPAGYKEAARKKLIEPNCPDIKERPVVWSHPAYSHGRVYLRNSTTLKCWRLFE